MFGYGRKDRSVDGGAEFRVGAQALLDGVVDERPKLLFSGRVSGVSGNQEDFVVFGERGDSRLLQGQ